MSSPLSQKPSPEKIYEMASAFQSSRILLTAFELDIFSQLEHDPKTSAEVAEIIHADPRATDRLMNALCALGLLIKNKDVFSNTQTADTFLVKSKTTYLGGLMHMVHLWDSWHTLTPAVKAGHQVAAGPLEKRPPEWFDAFITAMHQRAAISAPQTVSALDFAQTRKVLDVGGGSGAYAMAFAKAKENLGVTVFDLPSAIPLTRQFVAGEGMLNRIKFIEGDYTIDELGRDFDLVFLSAIIHSNSKEVNLELFKKAFRALNPGGQIVVQDFIMDDTRTQPVFGALFSLNMLVGTNAGDTFTANEVRNWMDRAGFAEFEYIEMEGPADIIIGKKPGHD